MGKSKNVVSKGEMDIDPAIVRFTHSRIRPWFTGCGRRIEETLQSLVNGSMTVRDLPPITVIVVKDSNNIIQYYSLNNRRLYVLKKLREMKLLQDDVVRVRVKSPLDREKDRYNPERCSLEATIMKEYKLSSEGVSVDVADDDDIDIIV